MFDYHSQQMALPASTQKIITAPAALLQLSRDYQFVTHFETEGKIIDHSLKGDLVVRFTGDPTLTPNKFATWWLNKNNLVLNKLKAI